jgi:translation initiation factor 5
VNGAHTDTVLQSLIHRYIENFVLCTNCHLPETDYKIKNDAIYQKCAACGAKEMVDMNHKLCTYILAQDKKAKKEAKKGDGKSKEDKKKAKEDKDKKKDKKKEKEGSDEEKKKKKDKKSDKKDKKKDKGEKEDEKGYIKEALLGKENGGDLGIEDGDSESVDSHDGVDDEGALSKSAL